MSDPGCSLAALLRAGGPIRLDVRPCCLAALVGRRDPSTDSAEEPVTCEAAEQVPARAGAAAGASDPAPAGDPVAVPIGAAVAKPGVSPVRQAVADVVESGVAR